MLIIVGSSDGYPGIHSILIVCVCVIFENTAIQNSQKMEFFQSQKTQPLDTAFQLL